MMSRRANCRPLVYSCSGCSSAAQMANWIALQLDRDGSAEMSCIAGVGGNVPKLVRVARSGRAIIAVDGCPLACALHCLRNCGVEPSRHAVLSEWGVRKRYHADFDAGQAADVLARVRLQVLDLAGDALSPPATSAEPSTAA
jgi:uncharacterized metal-binding protein